MNHKLRTLLTLCVFLFVYVQSHAQYYTTALGKNGAPLKTALHTIIKNHWVGTYNDLWTSFTSSDVKPNGKIWDIYSDIPGGTPLYVYTPILNQCGTYNNEGDCYNREHTWPQTYFGGNTPMYTDLQHIFPTDGWVNNKRGNLPYGIVKSGGLAWTSDNGSKIGSSLTYTNYVGDVFEPIDSFKGDLARVYFYMSTRYEGEDAGWTNWEMANGAVLKPDAINLLLSWHHLDPVSQKEIDRNNSVFLIQNNRNPFIDYPEFADCIWGTADCTSLNLKDVKLEPFITCFPVPATNALSINTKNNIKIQHYSIVDMIGNTLISNMYSTTQIDIHALPSGLYAIILNTDKGMAKKLFSKE